MRNKLKTILLTTAIILTTPSCALYKYTTFEPCLPKDKDDEINLKQRAKNYIAEPDGTYNVEFKINSYTKDKQLRLEKKFRGF